MRWNWVSEFYTERIKPNLESFGIILFGLGLLAVDLFSDAIQPEAYFPLILAGMIVLLFQETKPVKVDVPQAVIKHAADLDQVLRDRSRFDSYNKFLRDFPNGVHELCIYGPSAVIVNAREAVIEEEVLQKGGSLRVLFQDVQQREYVRNTLQNQLDQQEGAFLEDDIKKTRTSLKRLQQKYARQVAYKVMDYSPGFSLTVVNPKDADGVVIVEFFGYSIKMRDQRMHIRIAKIESEQWFNYWVYQFEAMWTQAKNEVI